MRPFILWCALATATATFAAAKTAPKQAPKTGPKDVVVRMKGGWELRRASVDSFVKADPGRVPSSATSELIMLEMLRRERITRGLPSMPLVRASVKPRLFEKLMGPRTERNGATWDAMLNSYEQEPLEVDGCEIPAFLLDVYGETLLPTAQELADLDTTDVQVYFKKRSQLIVERSGPLAKKLVEEVRARYEVEYLDTSLKPKYAR